MPSWIKIIDPTDLHYLSIIEKTFDKGEASAIALATEIKDCLLIVDDLKARKFALELGLTITGTLGIIVDAKLAGIIHSVKPIIDKIGQTDFRITKAIEKKILEKAGE